MADVPRLFQSFELRNGYKIPAIGLGTFQSDAGNDQVQAIVLRALRGGYRHIDTAADYGNETQVGQAVKECGIPREEIFVTTKLANHWHEPKDVQEALEKSLRNLQLDYVDLFLMHFPYAYATTSNHDKLRHANGKPIMNLGLSRQYPLVWQAMEGLVDSGKARAIGLSNFNILKTKRILANARIRPAVNQVELHPYFPQTELVDFCRSQGIHVTAHQPLGGKPLGVIARIAAESGRTIAQAILSWNVTRGVSVIPKTARESRLPQNLALSALSAAQMEEINVLGAQVGPIRYLDPRQHVGFDVFDEENDQPLNEDKA